MTTQGPAVTGQSEGEEVLGKKETAAIMPAVTRLVDAVARRDKDAAYTAWMAAVVAAREAGMPMTAVHVAVTYCTAVAARADGAAEEQGRWAAVEERYEHVLDLYATAMNKALKDPERAEGHLRGAFAEMDRLARGTL